MEGMYWDSRKKRWEYGEQPREIYPGVYDESGPMAPGVVESGQTSPQEFDKLRGQESSFDYKGAGMGAAKSAASGGSEDDVAAQGLMSSGNPYAMGAGLGLMVLSANQKAKYQEELAKYNQRQKALENMAAVANRIKV